MIRDRLLVACCLLPLLTAGGREESITLDPEAMDEVWREVSGSLPVAPRPGAVVDVAARGVSGTEGVAEIWREARQSVAEPEFPVLVLHMLQLLNPHMPMGDNVWAYAAALELHRRAFMGHARARAEMIAGLRSGKLSGLNYFVDATLADELEASAAPQKR